MAAFSCFRCRKQTQLAFPHEIMADNGGCRASIGTGIQNEFPIHLYRDPRRSDSIRNLAEKYLFHIGRVVLALSDEYPGGSPSFAPVASGHSDFTARAFVGGLFLKRD